MRKIRLLAAFVITFCLSGVLATSIQAQENRRVRIINRASSTIRYLYASNVDEGSWQEDLLGLWRVILPDHYMDANLDDGTGHCLYDIKAVLSDGREATTRGLNVCTTTSWTVYDQ